MNCFLCNIKRSVIYNWQWRGEVKSLVSFDWDDSPNRSMLPHRRSVCSNRTMFPLRGEGTIVLWLTSSSQVMFSADTRAYQMEIVVFLIHLGLHREHPVTGHSPRERSIDCEANSVVFHKAFKERAISKVCSFRNLRYWQDRNGLVIFSIINSGNALRKPTKSQSE